MDLTFGVNPALLPSQIPGRFWPFAGRLHLLLLSEAHSRLPPSPPRDQRAAGWCPAHDAQLPALLQLLRCHPGCLKRQ